MGRCEAEVMRRGGKVAILHASDKGRRLYERLGWTASNEMQKIFGGG